MFRKAVIGFIISCMGLLFSPIAEHMQVRAASSATTLQLVGTVGALPIHMSITVNAKNKVSGSYYYDKYKQKINLSGSLDGGHLSVTEYAGNIKATGHFYGEWLQGKGLVGVWSNPEETRQLPVAAFTAGTKLPSASPSDWNGEWNLPEKTQFDETSLSITNVKSDRLTFSIDSRSGGHFGDTGGDAKLIRPQIASYTEEETGHIIVLFLNPNKQIDVISPSIFGGGGVVFGGQYIKGQPKLHVLSLKELGVFEQSAQEQAFKQVVGNDYEDYLYTMQIVSEDENLDGFAATVVSGAVRGLYTSMEAIIMYDAKGHFWTAIIDNESGKVHFYTNVKGVKKLPKTIEEWRGHFSERKVVFKNK